jgi:hypothetical protein
MASVPTPLVPPCSSADSSGPERGDADRYRIASRGGSSGGYTTLALATFGGDPSVARLGKGA